MTINIENEYNSILNGKKPAGVTNSMHPDVSSAECIGVLDAAGHPGMISAESIDDSNVEGSAGFLSSQEMDEISRNVILRALEHEDCPYEAEVSLVITGDDDIRELNREHRHIDKSTDVLSFPMIDFPSPAEFSILEDESGDEYFNPDTGELMLGDIVISADHCIRQAEEYGHTVTREFAFLIAHSMLHLMGYDHMEPLEAKEMERRQEDILSSLNYLRT